MACNCGKNAQPAVKTMAPLPVAKSMFNGMLTEEVVVISTAPGWYTVDSGRRYKSYGVGTRLTIVQDDRPALENLGLISARS